MILSGSGTIMHSNMVGGLPPPSQSSLATPLPQQHLNSSHVPPAAPPPPPSAATSVLHHSSTFTTSSALHNSTHAALTLTAAQAAVSQALHGQTDTPQNQPVEFNHAINYVNKIKVTSVVVLELRTYPQSNFTKLFCQNFIFSGIRLPRSLNLENCLPFCENFSKFKWHKSVFLI